MDASINQQRYENEIRSAAARHLGSELSPDLYELLTRTAHLNALKQSERNIVSSSAVFAAAVLWGRELPSTAPAAIVRMAKLAQAGFDKVFLEDMLVSGYRSLLQVRISDPEMLVEGGQPIAFSASLQKLLEKGRGISGTVVA
jgi:hypothetical protein